MSEGLFNELVRGKYLKRLRGILTEGVASLPIWWEIPHASPKSLAYGEACRRCRFVRASSRNRKICQDRFLLGLETARREGTFHQFLCPIQRYAVCLPMVSQGQTLGFVAMCHSTTAIPQQTLRLAHLSLETAVQEAERNEELRNLSEAIQPRCIALSTIHTIHRLISSTLNLKELLPRVARLTCQVLRARYCEIWLVDPDKKQLVAGAAVDSLRVRNLPGRPLAMGQGRVGKVVSTCEARWSNHEMVVPLLEEEAIGVIRVRRKLKGPFSLLDHEILMTLAEQAVVAIRNAQMYERQERVTWGTIKSLSAILDGMDTHAPHGVSNPEVLAQIAMAIGRKLGLLEDELRPLQYAAWLHDAGRVGIPEEILRKRQKLTPEELAQVREHPIKGAQLFESMEILEPAIPIILHHHERYDGTGYPKGLKKGAIPLGARILAVANAFDAMVSGRPYRKAMSVAEASEEIASHARTQFDPQVVEAFLSVVRLGKMAQILKEQSSRAHTH